MGGAFSRNFPVAPCANIYRGVSRPVQADKLGVRATRDAAHLSISLVGARACTHSRRKMAHRGSRVNTCIKMSPVFRPSSPSSFSLPSLPFYIARSTIDVAIKRENIFPDLEDTGRIVNLFFCPRR